MPQLLAVETPQCHDLSEKLNGGCDVVERGTCPPEPGWTPPTAEGVHDRFHNLRRSRLRELRTAVPRTLIEFAPNSLERQPDHAEPGIAVRCCREDGSQLWLAGVRVPASDDESSW